MGLKFRNPEFNIWWKIGLFLLNKMPIFLSSLEVKRSVWTKKNCQKKMIKYFKFLRNKDYVHKLSSRSWVHNISFTSKRYQNHFYMYVSFVLFIWNHLQWKVFSFPHFNITLNCCVISKTISTGENIPWVPNIYN